MIATDRTARVKQSHAFPAKIPADITAAVRNAAARRGTYSLKQGTAAYEIRAFRRKADATLVASTHLRMRPAARGKICT